MNVHEYQAKKILQKYGIPVPAYAVASTLSEVQKIIREMELDQAVVKIQVHAGGRGKAGGVKLSKNKQEILDNAEKLIGMKIINNQTGSEGVVAEKVLISPLVNYQKEYYLACIIDRQNACAAIIASPEGGMDIEEVAEKSPEKILTFSIGNDGKIRGYQHIRLNKFMGWTGNLAEQGKKLVSNLARAFIECDGSLLEINPLVRTDENELVALDAKLSIDDNALYRQPLIAEFYDSTQIPANESLAKKHDLAYVSLDGNIGCMVNGAGLAMATMDIIKLYGGSPANFLDVGGGASQEKVAEGFKILLSDSKVKAILVNIFGGIMNCVTLSAGIIAAASELQVKVPLVVRMEGTNVEKGKKMLEDSGLNIQIAEDLAEAAEKVVKAAR